VCDHPELDQWREVVVSLVHMNRALVGGGGEGGRGGGEGRRLFALGALSGQNIKTFLGKWKGKRRREKGRGKEDFSAATGVTLQHVLSMAPGILTHASQAARPVVSPAPGLAACLQTPASEGGDLEGGTPLSRLLQKRLDTQHHH